MRSPRQTLSFLRELLHERGIEPKSKRGQNFLIDLNLLEVLLRRAELTRDDLAIEVGSGTGNMTARLAERAGAVLSVEIDPDFFELARENVDDKTNVVLLHTDVLRRKNDLNPVMLTALEALRVKSKCQHLKLVANLPYSVATPVIANFLISDVPVERMVVTVQWEIAARLLAEPGVKDYGALAVMVQSLAEVSLVRRLPPTVFWPRPQVDSAIVDIRPQADLRQRVVERVGGVQAFRNFLRDLYVHRRKNLRMALTGWPGGRRAKEDVDAKLAALNIDGRLRAETLDPEQHLTLCAAFAD